MALLQNGSNFSAEPYLRLGVTDVVSRTVPWSNNGRVLNLWWGVNPFSNLYGIPVSYSGGTAWIMPIVDGGIYTDLNLISGTGDVSSASNVWMGVAISTAISNNSGTISLANYDMFANFGITSLNASGNVTSAIITGVVQIDASNANSLSGSGGVDITSDLNLLIGLISSLNASGNISTANIIGMANMLAPSLDGSGDISSADMKRGVYVTSSILGNDGTITLAAQKGLAWMQSSIQIGALPSAIDNASAVLGSIIEGSYTLQDVLKILAAVNAGKVSGGPNNPIFRSIIDDKNVVSGTVDSDGNRTGVTITP